MSNTIIEGRFVTHEDEFYGYVEVNAAGLIEKVVKRVSGNVTHKCPAEFMIFPGFIDIHVHAREAPFDEPGQDWSYKEDFRTASEAAINGGITAFMAMPNDPIPTSTLEVYEKKKQLAKKSLVDTVLYYVIMPGSKPFDINAPAKVYLGNSTGNCGFERDEDIDPVLSQKGYRGRFVAFHCESPNVLRAHEGAVSHEMRRPREAEIKGAAGAIKATDENSFDGHITHISTMEALELKISARRRGIKVTAGVTPGHVYPGLLSIDRQKKQVNPPLRTLDDTEALESGLKEGQIELLETDHAPHTMADKEKGASGMPYLDTFGSFTTWLLDRGMTPQRLAEVAAYNPGRIFSRFRDDRYGEIKEGYVGSFTVINPNAPTTVTRSMLRTKCGWSPFEGQTFPGRVEATIVRGNYHRTNWVKASG